MPHTPEVMKTGTLFPILGLLVASLCNSTVGQAGAPIWTNLFSAPLSPYAGARTLGTDPAGNIYVVGLYGSYTTSSLATVKFTRNGMPLWTNQYRLTGHEWNGADSIAVAPNGEVCVTGCSTLTRRGTNQPMFSTLRYSAAGIPLWTNQFKSACSISTSESNVEGISTTSLDNAGNAYVTSFVSGWSDRTTNDYQVIKFSDTGVPMWTNRFDGIAHGDDSLASLKVLPSGHIVVTGSSGGNGGTTEIVTIGYTSAGLALWTNRFNGAGKNYASDMGVNESGNIYVLGSSLGMGSSLDYDFLTLAYTETGVPLWTNRFGKTYGLLEIAKSIAVGGGLISVSGDSQKQGELPGTFDIATTAYTTAGIPIWTNTYSPNDGLVHNDTACSVTIDPAGNSYVTGTTTLPGEFAEPDWVTMGYSSTGIPLWTNWFGNFYPGYYDEPSQTVTDSDGNVIVTGRQQVSANNSINNFASVIIKYAGASPSPILLSIQSAGQDLILSWPDNRFSLQSAPAATGVFGTIAGASNPYTNSPGQSEKFFRLVAQ